MTTMTPAPGTVTGGVDTHADIHVAAAVDHLGGVLGTAEFDTTAAGYRRLLAWLRGFGPLHKVGVEGTGSYGAGLARHLTEQGVQVVEVARPNRQLRRRRGKSDTLDAVAAAREVLSGEATATPKTHDGPVECLRALKVVQRSAEQVPYAGAQPAACAGADRPGRAARAAAGAQDRRAGADLRGVPCRRRRRQPARRRAAVAASSLSACSTSRGSSRWSWLACTASPRPPRPRWSPSRVSARTSPRPCWSPPATTRTGCTPKPRSPHCAAAPRCRPTAARSRTVTDSTGVVTRNANAALWRIAIVRLSHDPRTRDYLAKRTADGKNTGEVLRCLKRYIACEVFAALPRDLVETASQQAAA
jgi:transposase